MDISQRIPVWLMWVILTLGLGTAGVLGTIVDLRNACNGANVKFCVLTNVTSSFEDPLKVINYTAGDLEELIIRNSAVGRIPTVIFERTPHLRRFIMHRCGLNRLMSGDFRDVAQLKMLALQENRLFNVPENAFIELGSGLEQLYLGHNAIHILHRRAFTGLSQLQYLEAQYNGIRSLQGGVFDDLLQLQHIDLSHNELEIIDSETFAKNKKLSTILLSDNKFSVFEPSSLNHLPHLRLLDLSYTVLVELYVQSVDVLLVQGSGLTSCQINGGVLTLNANNNALKSLQISDPLSVRDLYLNDNKFETLEDFNGMLNLQRLEVAKNLLSKLYSPQSSRYLRLPDLQYLNVASNRLANLTQDDFILMTKLSTLDLAFNHLSHLDTQVLEPLKNLEKLYLEGNRLEEFNYQNIHRTHGQLHEIGLNQNNWNEQYMEKMASHFQLQGIQVVKRLITADTPLWDISTDSEYLADTSMDHDEMHSLAGVSGIHPYWTMKDILSVITLMVVLLILLIQFYNIMQEEGCCHCRCWCRHREDDEATEPLTARHRLVVDDNSSV